MLAMYRAFLPSPALEAGRRSLRVRCTTATTTIACLRHPALPLRPFSSIAAAQAQAQAQAAAKIQPRPPRAKSRTRAAALPTPPGKVKNKANKAKKKTSV